MCIRDRIYDRPANTFVAGFIGSPAMNLVSGSISGGTFTGPNVTIKGLKADDGAITLGFRAEDVEVVKRGGDAKAPVYSMELLGDATQVSIRSGSEILSGKAPKDFRADIGAPIGFKIDPAVCHLFDPQTGSRL